MGALMVSECGVQFMRVDGESMEPTLEGGDLLLVNRLQYELDDPRPGDVVTLYYPADPVRVFIKRVIAREEQAVQMIDGRVFVDGARLQDDYVTATFRGHQNWGPQVVSAGYYFVLGDHRNHSWDSRDWGFVPRRYITGKVVARWWPPKRLSLVLPAPTRQPPPASPGACR
jgi:signal peptidase I